MPRNRWLHGLRTAPLVFLVLAAVLFSILLGLRLAAPDHVVETGLGSFLSFGFALAFFIAAGLQTRILGGHTGRGLVGLSACVAWVALDLLLDLRYFGDELLQPIGLVFVAWGVAVAYGWWRVIRHRRATMTLTTRPVFDIGALFLLAVVLYAYFSR